MKDLRELNSYRNMEKQKRLGKTDIRKSLYGVFDIPLDNGEFAVAIADNGLGHYEWEHVSVSTSHRCLTWEEMCKIKDLFFYDTEVVIQIHPAKENYVNCYEYCLHLWRPKTQKIPLPPPEIV